MLDFFSPSFLQPLKPKKKKLSSLENPQDGERRVRGVELVLPVVLGSCAFPLGKKATDAETHKWTVYVRGATPKKAATTSAAAPGQQQASAAAAAAAASDPAIAAAGEDISDVVSKVVFNLHPTFHNPTREVSEPPFELSEMGWGEFDLTAVLHFVDAAGEPPLELAHKLRLYSDADPQGTNSKKPVVAEVYDEVVFTEPREAFWRAASRARGGGGANGFAGLRPSPRPYSTAAHFGAPAPEDELRRLGVARQRVAQVMTAVRKQMDTLDAHAAAGGSAAQFAAAQQQRRAQQQQQQQMQQQQQHQMQMQQMQMQQNQQQQQQAQAAAAAAAAAAGLPPGFPPPEAMMM